jgi:hypothetical protein
MAQDQPSALLDAGVGGRGVPAAGTGWLGQAARGQHLTGMTGG